MESNSCCCCYDYRNHLIMMTVISIETTVKKMQGIKLKKIHAENTKKIQDKNINESIKNFIQNKSINKNI